MSYSPTAPSEPAYTLNAQSIRASDGTDWLLWTSAPATDFPAGFERLDLRIGRGAVLSFLDAQTLLASLLTVLASLHQRDPRTTHGGVTPSTVYLRPDGAVALLAPDAPPFAPNTLTCGAIGFFSPEFALGFSSPSDDVFAAAMTVLSACVGAHPRTLEYVNLRPRLDPHFADAPGLLAVLTRMTEPLAAHRFPDAMATLEYMRTLLTGLPTKLLPTDEFSRGFTGAAHGVARRFAAPEIEALVAAETPRAVWPARARASSTYGGGWSASAVVGGPKVFPAHGDKQGAWAPKAAQDGVQWLDVAFHTEQHTAAVWVLETNMPGAVYALVDQTPGSEGATLWSAAPHAVSASVAQVLEVPVDPPRVITALRLWLDTSIGASWNEIDSVALLSAPPAHPSTTTTSGPRRKPRAPKPRTLTAPPNDGARIGTAQRIAHDDMTSWGWTDFTNPRFVWPTSANASSTYGGGWSPSAVVGPPKVYPRAGDIQGAWAPKSGHSGVQWLDVTFSDDAPEATVMLVFETHNPGAVYAVQVLGGDDDGALLWKGPSALSPESPQVLMIEFDEARRVPAVRLWLDTDIASGWTEIDTVALVIGRETAMR